MELRVFKNVSIKLFILTLLKLLSLYIRASQSVYKLVAVASDSVKRESVELITTSHNPGVGLLVGLMVTTWP